MQAPVTVTHHGRPRVVILSAEDYERLANGGAAPAQHRSTPGQDLEAHLQGLLSGMEEGFLAFDTQLRITAVNAAAETYLGRTAAQLMGQPLYPPELAERGAVILDRLHWVIRSGESATFETRSLLKDSRHLRGRAFPYGDGVGVIFTNITQLTALREEQAAWRAERQALAEHGGIGLAALSLHGFFTEANAAFVDFIGFDAAQLAEVRLADLAAPTARHDLALGLNQLLQQKTDTYRAEVEFLTRELGRRPLALSIARKMCDELCEGFSLVALPV